MGRRMPLSRVLSDLIKKGRIPGPPPGGYRWLHGLALSGIVPAERDPHTPLGYRRGRLAADRSDNPRCPGSLNAPAVPGARSHQPSRRARRAAAVAA